MSEYQFYEFAALDGPVEGEGAAYARSVSSRAEITSRRWRNVYNWGDFRGSVEQMMEYYDAHVYMANWGAFRLMLAFQPGALPLRNLQPYLTKWWLERMEIGGRTVLCWSLEDAEGDGGWLDGSGILDLLLPIREELLRGDCRSLYLGWLAHQSYEPDDGDDDPLALGPPVPPGMADLTMAQDELSERLGVDEDLLAVTEKLAVPARDLEGELAAAIGRLGPEEMAQLLLRVATGDGSQVSGELNVLTAEAASPGQGVRQVVAYLHSAASFRREERHRLAREEHEREQQGKEAKRRERLQEVIARAESIWSDVVALADRRVVSAYDEAVVILEELKDACELAGRSGEFLEQLVAFRKSYPRLSGLKSRTEHLLSTNPTGCPPRNLGEQGPNRGVSRS
jgi:hypothetical protein